MKLRHKIGFGIYLLNAIMGMAVGSVYLFSGKVMPYHAQVIGKNWAELDQGVQIILLSLVQNFGIAVVSLMFFFSVVLFIPFRRGEKWANWTLFLGSIIFSGSSFFVTFKVYLATNVQNAWPSVLIGMILGLLGFLFSMGMEKEKK